MGIRTRKVTMPYRRTSQWIVVGVSTAITVFCIYITILSVKAENTQNIWIFSLFAALFATPFCITVFHFLADRSPTLARIHKDHISLGQKHKTTFVPHWFVMSGMVIIGLIILYTILKWAFIYFER